MSTATDKIKGADPFERALFAGMNDTLDVPIAEMLDPAKTRPEFLPFLAHANSVDLWFDDWSDDRKRQIIAEWPEIAARIGTRAGIERILKYVDAELVDVMAPPQSFVVGSIDDKAIAAWKARLPQLRIYNRTRPAPGKGRPYRRFVIGRSALSPEIGWAYAGPEGVLYDPKTGTETSLHSVDMRRSEKTSTETGIFRAIIPGKTGRHSMVIGRSVIGRSGFGVHVPAREITWSETETAKTLSATALVEVASPTLTPIDPRFEEVPVRIARKGEATFGRFVIGRSRISANRARHSYFKRLYLSDPSITAPGARSHGRAVIGRTPHRFPAFTARLLIRLKQRSSRRAFVIGRAAIGSKVVRKADTEAQSRALSALRIAKAPEEKHLVSFATKRPVTFGDQVTFDGSTGFGSFVDRTKL